MSTKAIKRVAVWGAVALALLVSGAWAALAMRWTGLLLFGLLLLAVLVYPLHKRKIIVCLAWVAFFTATLIPVDVRFDNQPGVRARIIPILWGLPTAEGRAMIQNGEVWEGGDLVSGWEPKWAIVL